MKEPSFIVPTYDAFAREYDVTYLQSHYLDEDQEVSIYLLAPIYAKTVIDVGCGTGFAIEWLGITPDDYFGLDPSRGMLTEFHRKHPKYSAVCEAFEDSTLLPEDVILGLFGSPSYVNPDHYGRLKSLAREWYFLMFYREGYVPTYYPQEQADVIKAYIDYPRIKETFACTFEWHDFLIATNLISTMPWI